MRASMDCRLELLLGPRSGVKAYGRTMIPVVLKESSSGVMDLEGREITAGTTAMYKCGPIHGFKKFGITSNVLT